PLPAGNRWRRGLFLSALSWRGTRQGFALRPAALAGLAPGGRRSCLTFRRREALSAAGPRRPTVHRRRGTLWPPDPWRDARMRTPPGMLPAGRRPLLGASTCPRRGDQPRRRGSRWRRVQADGPEGRAVTGRRAGRPGLAGLA